MSKGIFSKLGKTVKKIVFRTSFIFALFFIIDVYFLQDKCRSNQEYAKNLGYDQVPEKRANNSRQTVLFPFCTISQLTINIYNSILASIITLCLIELAMHEDTVEEIRKIFNSSNAIEYIKSFKIDTNVNHQDMAQKIKDSKSGDEIKIIGLENEVSILKAVNVGIIEQKVKEGVKFKILVLDIESSLTDCLQKTHNDFRRIKNTLRGNYEIFSTLRDRLGGENFNVDEKFELKVKKDIYSPVCYFSFKNSRLEEDFMGYVWMYFFSEGGIQYPAFEILDSSLFREAEKHFDYLWGNSKHYLIREQNNNAR